MPVSRAANVQFGASTDAGLARSNNEDRYRADPRLGLFVVVDGVGGQNAGEVAAESIAVVLHKAIEDTSDGDGKTYSIGVNPALSHAGNRLRMAILRANQTLAERIAANEDFTGMAATMTAMLLDPPLTVVANVGDCRGYLFRADTLTQITKDHSWVAEQVRLGLLDEEAARRHPMRNIVTRAVDGSDHLTIDFVEFEMQPHDTLLLCSDGLSGMVTDEDIRRCLIEALPDAEESCRRLVEAANQAGGKDNITVIVVRIGVPGHGDAMEVPLLRL